MNPQLPRRTLVAFFHALEGKLGGCKSGADQSISRKILKKLHVPRTSIETFLAACTALGGYCDCEVFYNTCRHWLPDVYPPLLDDEE
jgi:hypothetical protein